MYEQIEVYYAIVYHYLCLELAPLDHDAKIQDRLMPLLPAAAYNGTKTTLRFRDSQHMYVYNTYKYCCMYYYIVLYSYSIKRTCRICRVCVTTRRLCRARAQHNEYAHDVFLRSTESPVHVLCIFTYMHTFPIHLAQTYAPG